MAKAKKIDPKTIELKRTGTLNPHPADVSDTLFKENPFFDPKDLLQVRYEMLRRHSVEGHSIVDIATNFRTPDIPPKSLVNSKCLRTWCEPKSVRFL